MKGFKGKSSKIDPFKTMATKKGLLISEV